MLDGLRGDSADESIGFKVFVANDDGPGSDDASVGDFRPVRKKNALPNPATVPNRYVLV